MTHNPKFRFGIVWFQLFGKVLSPGQEHRTSQASEAYPRGLVGECPPLQPDTWDRVFAAEARDQILIPGIAFTIDEKLRPAAHQQGFDPQCEVLHFGPTGARVDL